MYLTFFKDKEERQTNRDYSIDDLFAGVDYESRYENVKVRAKFDTKTVITDSIPRTHDQEKIQNKVEALKELASGYNPEQLILEYNTFYIPKKAGGLREINAPTPRLMETLRDMKNIFQYDLKVLYHNAAYAYVPKRNIVDALKVHQKYHARWFLKLDIKDFFPNCSIDFVVEQLLQIYPFCTISEEDLRNFIWICFRNNQLPQGTPMSPMLTNLIMIPIDYAIQEYCIENQLTYTRYADDILISKGVKWNWQQTVNDIQEILRNSSPFEIKTEKTRFGSSAGRNWNLGLMYNKDQQITVGYRNKKNYKAMLHNLMEAEKTNEHWTKDELYYFQGITAYYKSVEPEYFYNLIKRYEREYGITLKSIYKANL